MQANRAPVSGIDFRRTFRSRTSALRKSLPQSTEREAIKRIATNQRQMGACVVPWADVHGSL
jgi:hypothetical protein